MTDAVSIITDFAGLILSRDRKQLTQPGLLDGNNVMVSTRGPYSAFAAELISEAVLANPEKVSTFRVGDDIVILGTGVVLSFNDTVNMYYPLHQFTDANNDFPWSHAHVGGVHWFSKPGIGGLLKYNATSGIWQLRTTSDNAQIPANPYAVWETDGRLVILSNGLTQWSALDDGEDLTTSISTGAGAQSLAVIGQGTPLGGGSTATGFVVFTTTGVATFLSTNAAVPFRFKRISTLDIPINPFVISQLEQGKIVYLALTGLRITDGGIPQVWQPEMGAYFVEQLFQKKLIDVEIATAVKFSYSPVYQWFFISIADVSNVYLYNKSFVLNLLNNKWGVFNRAHYAFGELHLTQGINAGFNFGFTCSNGFVRRFAELPRFQITAQTDYTYNYTPVFEIPVMLGLNEFISYGILSHVDFGILDGESPGVYSESAADVFDVPVDARFLSVNSWALIGPVRFTDATNHAMLSNIQGFSIGTEERRDVEEEYEDYNDIGPTTVSEDWANVGAETFEDWGVDVIIADDFSLTVYGTLDGYTVFEANEKIPDLVELTPRISIYSVDVTGIFHILRITADGTGESFHLNTAEFSAILAGQLSG